MKKDGISYQIADFKAVHNLALKDAKQFDFTKMENKLKLELKIRKINRTD